MQPTDQLPLITQADLQTFHLCRAAVASMSQTSGLGSILIVFHFFILEHGCPGETQENCVLRLMNFLWNRVLRVQRLPTGGCHLSL